MPLIHPRTDIWSARTLRFHVAFDRPMDMDRAMRHVRLDRDDGDGFATVSGAFVDLPDGLWTPDQRVITILLHPGRVKSGLAAHAALGRAIVCGRTHRIVVDAAMPDADGRPLGHPVEHHFTGGPPAPAPLVPKVRRHGDGFAVSFDRPADYLSALAHIALVDGRGAVVPSHRDVLATTVALRSVDPDRLEDGVAVRIDPAPEDAEGNRTQSVFEARAGDGPARATLPPDALREIAPC